ncbi:MAG: T9SS type A sorting domain-containing protein [Bacteroidota bacterium]
MKNLLMLFAVLFHTSINAQNCNESEHSDNIHDSWLSCEVSANPNPIRGASHWVLYDLGYVYSLGATHFWNYNVEGETANGMKNITIDISSNGTNWTEVGSFQLSEATGNPYYEGEEGLHLGATDARFVLITAVDTWGSNCAGLSEVKFDIEGIVPVANIENEKYYISLFPNPATKGIYIKTEWDFKEIVITNATGQEIIRQSFTPNFDISNLPDGVYILKLINNSNEFLTKGFVKQSN